MKRVIVSIVLLFIGLGFGFGMGVHSHTMNQEMYIQNGSIVSEYHGKSDSYKLTVESIVSLDNNGDEIVIKDNQEKIVFSGDKEFIPDNLLKLEISEIASCDDSTSTLVVFLR